MAIVSSGQISIKDVGDEKGLPSNELSLQSLSTNNVNTLDPSPKVPANTSGAEGNYPDTVAPHAISEFYAYNHNFTTTTTAATTTTTEATTTTTAPTTTTTEATTTTTAPTTTTTAPTTTTTEATTTTTEATTTTTEATTTTTAPTTTTTEATTTTTEATTTTTEATTTTTEFQLVPISAFYESNFDIIDDQDCITSGYTAPDTTIYLGSDNKYYEDSFGSSLLGTNATAGYVLFELVPDCDPPVTYPVSIIMNISGGVPAQTFGCTNPAPPPGDCEPATTTTEATTTTTEATTTTTEATTTTTEATTTTTEATTTTTEATTTTTSMQMGTCYEVTLTGGVPFFVNYTDVNNQPQSLFVSPETTVFVCSITIPEWDGDPQTNGTITSCGGSCDDDGDCEGICT